MREITSAWLRPADNIFQARLPRATPLRIVYPLDYLPTAVSAQTELIDSFVDDMEECLNANVTRISLRKLWEESAPEEGASSDIEEFLRDVVAQTYYYSFYHASDDFRQQYREKFGHKPYVISFVEQRWAYGAAVTEAQHMEGLRRLDVYRSWLLDVVFKTSTTLVVLPISPVEPHYRDEVTPSPTYQTATDELFFSPILRSPDVVVPIGEILYHSKITDREEYLPVAVNVVGAPGMDNWVLYSVEKVLKMKGRPTEVRTGRRIFNESV